MDPHLRFFFFSGVRLLWDGVSFLELTVPPKFRNKICGLCGNFNGDPRDDFFGRKGKDFRDGQHFGDSWRVGGMRACSILPRDMPRSYEPHCTQSWESRISSVRYCNALNSTLFDKCRAKVDPRYYSNACKLDMCECPGDQCHCEVLTAYARECERAGFMVHNWRESTGCKNVTSFRYSGTSNHLSKEDDDDDNDVDVDVDKNDVLPMTDVDELASTKFVPTGLGDFLPACSPDTADHCQPEASLEEEVVVKKKENKNGKKKKARQELREKRRKERKEKRREKKKMERQKKRQERRRMRQLEKERKDRKRKNRNQNRNRRPEPDDDDDDVDDIDFDNVNVKVTRVKTDGGSGRRKLSWAKYEKGKPPPFEFLLSSASASAAASKETEDEEYQAGPLDLEPPANFKPPSQRVRSGGRVPLPLLEGGGGAGDDNDGENAQKVRDASVRSESAVSGVGVGVGGGSRTSAASTSTSTSMSTSAVQSQRENRNWKKNRRRSDEGEE